MSRVTSLSLLFIAIACVCALLVTYGKADATQAEDDVAAAVESAFDTFNQGDLDGFVGHFTDAGLVAFASDPGEPLTPEEARMEIEGFIGLVTLELQEMNVESVQQEVATVRVRFDAGGQQVIQTLQLVISDGTWLIDAVTNEDPEVPEGYEAVPVELFEYGFGFDQSLIQVGDQIAFDATNVGVEAHEIVFARVPADLDLESAFNSPETPEGVVDLGFTFVGPGETGVAVVDGPIEAGRYVMLCFVSDPQGNPHVVNGMVADFTVGQTSPEPPATGTGVAPGDGPIPWQSHEGIALLALASIAAIAVTGFVAHSRLRRPAA